MLSIKLMRGNIAVMLDFNAIRLNEVEKKKNSVNIKEISSKDIAIIGISVKFPAADDIAQFWNNIMKGQDCITEFPNSRRVDTDAYLKYMGWTVDGLKYNNGAYLDEIDKFDYSFFRLSPKEASLMSPNQRMFLQTAWGAIEDAGYGGRKIIGSRTGIYLGFEADAPYDYKKIISDIDPSSMSVAVTGNLSPVIASRISYLLDLKGPSMSIDTTCSSSLVAIHLACRGIRYGECEMAIAGSVRINFLPLEKQLDFGVNSSDGRARTFDDSSDGTGSGEGVAAILLKPLSRALTDGDNIYAVIKGSAINQDGNSIGLSAPNVLAQEEVIASAWQDAEIDPETITYIEAHGTGTKLGDPIEIGGIQQAFRRYTEKRQFCAVGSVKTNIGHLDNAAGIAGLVKAVMALKYGKIPPSLHFNRPNKKIDFVESPVYVSDRLIEWETKVFPRRCGISSFGFAGTNCHMVLEEYPMEPEIKRNDKDLNIFTLSAKSKEVLEELVGKFIKYFKAEKDILGSDLCYTLNTGRWHHNYRLAIVAKGSDFIGKLDKVKLWGFYEDKENGTYYAGHNIAARDHENAVKELTAEAGAKIKEFISKGKKDEDLLHEICRLYIKGADVEWKELYVGEKVRTVSLPVYPFERKRCWVAIPEMDMQEKRKDLYYEIAWENEELMPVVSKKQETVLVFKDAGAVMGSKLAACLRGEGMRVIEVDTGKAFERVGEDSYTAGESEEDYERLLEYTGLKEISVILHLMTVGNTAASNPDELAGNLNKGVYSLFHLTRAVLKNNVSQKLVLLSEYANEITLHEKLIIPENAAFFGLARAIGQEYPHIKVRCIDMDETVSAENILLEIQCDGRASHIAYRNHKRYSGRLIRMDIDRIRKKELEIRKNGVYLITGGMGGIGLEIGKYLASKSSVRIALINRTEIPGREEWEDILHRSKDRRLCKKIAALKEMEKAGAEVRCYAADIASVDEMQAVLDNIRYRYGKIDGIIHCAGVAADGLLITKDVKKLNGVLSPKVSGTWLLDQMTKQDAIDFFVLFSSITAIAGAPGQTDYTAANAYLDAFSIYRNRQGRRTLSVNWPAWGETGMAAEYGVVDDNQIFSVLTTAAAIEIFDDVINRDLTRVIVGKLNYSGKVYGKTIQDMGIELSDELRKEAEEIVKYEKSGVKAVRMKQPGHVALKGKEGEDYTEAEKQIAEIWKEVLGFEEFDIHDNFFEIGGDSILITKVHLLLTEQYPGKVTVMDLFSYPTISKLSQYLCRDEIIIRPVGKRTGSEGMTADKEILDLFSEFEKGSISLERVMQRYNAMEVTNE